MVRNAVCGMMLTLLFIGMSTLAFNIQGVRASGTLYIDSDYTFTSNIYEPIVVTADNITIDGNGYTLEGPGIEEYEEIGFDLYEEGAGGRSNVTIKNVNINGWGEGIYLQWGSNNIISGNNITNNFAGISVKEAERNIITQNYIANNTWGVDLSYLHDSHNIVIRNNLTNNSIAINIYDSSHETITQNSIMSNGIGINLWLSVSNTITQNNLLSNNVGILLEVSHVYGGGENTITQNNIQNNGIGIELSLSHDNDIYHNDFIDNTLQVYDRMRDKPCVLPECSSINIWDNGYPSGGNYWSDYTGVDLCSGPFQNVTGRDGIGDAPNVIDANNTDRYPLMNPWHLWATVCSVWTTDADGDPKVRFDPGETVYVRWSANGMVNMTVYAPDGVTIDQEWTFLLSSGVVSFVPSHGMGTYEIECTGARPKPIAIATFLLIPQLPFMATLLTLVTMLGTAYVFTTKKRKKKSSIGKFSS